MEPERDVIEGQENNAAGSEGKQKVATPKSKRGLPFDTYDGVYYTKPLLERRGNRENQSRKEVNFKHK